MRHLPRCYSTAAHGPVYAWRRSDDELRARCVTHDDRDVEVAHDELLPLDRADRRSESVETLDHDMTESHAVGGERLHHRQRAAIGARLYEENRFFSVLYSGAERALLAQGGKL